MIIGVGSRVHCFVGDFPGEKTNVTRMGFPEFFQGGALLMLVP